MARARLRIVTVRDEDILSSEPPDSKAVPIASPDSARKASKAKTASPKTESPKTESPKTESPKTESPKTESPKTESPKTESLETGSLKGGAFKREAPKSKQPKASSTKASTATEPKAVAKRTSAAPKPIWVADLMRKEVVTCSAAETLSSVGQLMWDNNVGVVVVVDEASRPIAAVTDRDLAMAAYTQGVAVGHIGVGICMSKQLHTCRVDADAAYVARLMREHQIRRVPVVNGDGQLVGIVGLSDLLSVAGNTNAKTTSKSVDVLAALTGILS